MMTREDRQEALSLAYVHAVAAACGMTHAVPSKDYGIDLTLNEIREESRQFTESGWAVAVQLKSTTVVGETPTTITYDLTVKAYNALRLPTPTRRILVLGVLPADEQLWVRQTRQTGTAAACVLDFPSRTAAGQKPVVGPHHNPQAAALYRRRTSCDNCLTRTRGGTVMPIRSVSWAPKPDVFQAVSLDAIDAFLIRRGWVRKPSSISLMRRYEHPERYFTDGERMFYVFPDIDASDEYPDRVKSFAENFARFYQLDPHAVLAELQGGPVAEAARTTVPA